MNKNIYFTSDWHIGHEAIIIHSQRPFRDVQHQSQVLINNYNTTVRTNDICYFLGDMGLTSGGSIRDVVDKLNGTKILILGNHDRKGRQFWYSCGFSIIINTASLIVGKQVVTMSHCPLINMYREDTSGMKGSLEGENWHGESRPGIIRYTLPYYGQFHLHGHIHSPNGGKSIKILGKQFDVGIDANKYRPVSISKIESWVGKYKEEGNA